MCCHGNMNNSILLKFSTKVQLCIEIVKGGFWCSLPLLRPLLWCANAVDAYNLAFIKDPICENSCPSGYFIISTIYYIISTIYYIISHLPSFGILRFLVIRLHRINCEIVIFGLFLSCIKRGAHHKSAPKGVNLHQDPPFTISLPYPIG